MRCERIRTYRYAGWGQLDDYLRLGWLPVADLGPPHAQCRYSANGFAIPRRRARSPDRQIKFAGIGRRRNQQKPPEIEEGIAMVAAIKNEINTWDDGYVRYHARRRGFQVITTRGREHKRREKAGLGTFMLLGDDGVVLFEATLADIAHFLKNHDYVRQSRLH
jgi:hypothetical protein